jgi:hypothetical protein
MNRHPGESRGPGSFKKPGDQEHRARSQPGDVVGHAPQQNLLEQPSSLGSQDHQGEIAGFQGVKNHRDGMSLGDVTVDLGNPGRHQALGQALKEAAGSTFGRRQNGRRIGV